MNSTKKNGRQISRRGILPLLGSGLLMPFFGFGNNQEELPTPPSEDEEYQTLLKPDGSAVKVKVSTLKNAKVVKKGVSNKSLLTWLGKKL